MKKVLPLLIWFCLFTLLTGCGNQETEPSVSPTEVLSEPIAEITESLAPNTYQTSSSKLETADNVESNVSVPESYQTVWKSNTGQTEINVNATIQTPEKLTFDIVEIRPRLLTEDEIIHWADMLFGDGEYKLLSGSEDHSYYYVSFQMTGDGRAYREVMTANESGFVWFFNSEKGKAYYSNVARFAKSEGDTAKANSYTRDEALTLAKDIAKLIDPSFTLAAEGVMDGAIAGATDPNAKELLKAEEQAYHFLFTRTWNGVSATYTSQECDSLDDWNDDYTNPVPYETIYIVVSSDGIYAVNYSSPFEVAGVQMSAQPIMNFDEICSIAASVLPLSIGASERYYDSIVANVDRIVLGYMRVKSKDNPNQYTLRPVWDFFGEVLYDGMALNDIKYLSLITIDAINGTIIDRGYGY